MSSSGASSLGRRMGGMRLNTPMSGVSKRSRSTMSGLSTPRAIRNNNPYSQVTPRVPQGYDAFLPPDGFIQTSDWNQGAPGISYHGINPDRMDYAYQKGLTDAADYRGLFDNPPHLQPSKEYKNTNDSLGSAYKNVQPSMQRRLRKDPDYDRTWRDYASDIAVPVTTAAGTVYGILKGAAMGAAAGPPGMIAGGIAGGALGTYGGNLIGQGLQSITGQGDYTVGPSKPKYNTLTNSTDIPQFKTKGRTNVVAHREYLGDVYSGPTLASGTTDYDVNTYSLNPGLQASFPWLHDVAKNYEEYIIHGMVFEYKSTSADALNSTNTALGTVIMGTQYNVNSAAFVNKQQMENYEFSQSARPSVNQLHAIECSPKETPIEILFTRTGTQTDDLRLYDLAKFSIATQGMQAANVNIGELWCTYHIELLKPKIPAGIPNDASHLQTTGSAGANTFGTATIASYGSLALTRATGNQITWDIVPSAKYLICINMNGTGGVTTTYAGIASVINLVAINYNCNSAGHDQDDDFKGFSGALCTQWTTTITVQAISNPKDNGTIPSTKGALTYNTGSVMPTGTGPYMDIWVMALPDIITA